MNCQSITSSLGMNPTGTPFDSKYQKRSISYVKVKKSDFRKKYSILRKCVRDRNPLYASIWLIPNEVVLIFTDYCFYIKTYDNLTKCESGNWINFANNIIKWERHYA